MKNLFIRKRKIEMGDFYKAYSLTDTVLGAGAYGTVKLATVKTTNQLVAVKIVDKFELDLQSLKKVREEVKIIGSLDHPNVVRVLDSFEDSNNIYLVMEHIKGQDLLKMVLDGVEFTELQTRKIIATLAETLAYCNSQGVVHRDLKLANVMAIGSGDDMTIKVIDFNLAKNLDKDLISHNIMQTEVGTACYRAPETFDRELPYNFKCDVWSIGVIAFILLSRYAPFPVQFDYTLRFEPVDAWCDISDQAKDFIKSVLVEDPNARFDYSQLLAHSWFKLDLSHGEPSEDRELSSERVKEMRRSICTAGFFSLSAGAFAELMESDDEDNYEEDAEDFFA